MEKSRPIKVMIIEDYLIFRNGLKILLETKPYFKVAGEVNDLSGASLEMIKWKPDVVIISSREMKNPGSHICNRCT